MKPTILFILHLPPPVHGAAMMGKYIHDSKLINESFDCHYINLTTAKDLSDIGKVGFKKFLQFFRLLQTIRTEINRLKPALVYVTPNAKGGAFYKDFIVVQMIKALGCKIVAHYHNKGVSTRQDKILDNILYKLFFKGIKVILLASALYEDIKKYVRKENVYICPNGIPETLLLEPNATKDNNVPHLLFLSNLLESKGVLVLLDACKILKDKGLKFICDFIGGETAEIDKERFQCEVEIRGLNNHIVYHGKKYRMEKDEKLRMADIFLFPTFYHNECFPLVLLEAMQQSVTCISTNEGGIADIIDEGKTGYIIEKNNPQALADKIEILLDNEKLRQDMGENGYRKFQALYTLEAFERQFIKILQQALTDFHKLDLIISKNFFIH